MPHPRGWLWVGAYVIAGVCLALVAGALGAFTIPVGILIVLGLAQWRAGVELIGISVGVAGFLVGTALWGIDASAVTPVATDFGSPRVVGLLRQGPFSSVQLQVAPSGRGAVIWQHPAGGREALELVVLGRNGVLGAPVKIATVPPPDPDRGDSETSLAVSDRGEITVAVAPITGGLSVITREQNGAMLPAQQLVERWWTVHPAIAVDRRGSVLLEWSQTRTQANTQYGATRYAWRRAGDRTFGASIPLASAKGPALRGGGMQASSEPLFTGIGRATLGIVGRSSVELRFARVGSRFASRRVLWASSSEAPEGADFKPDRRGGVFAAWFSLADVPGMPGYRYDILRETHVAGVGREQPPSEITRGDLEPVAVTEIGRERAMVVWYAHGEGYRAATVDRGAVRPFSNLAAEPDTLAANGVGRGVSFATDAGATGLLAWSRTVRQPTATDADPTFQIRYATIPAGAHAFCAARTLALSPTAPTVALDEAGSGYLLWVGRRQAGAPITLARWRRHTSPICP